jgi:hypothetical protein
VVEGRPDLALTLQRVDAGCALHFIRYDYDEETDRVPPLERLVLDVRLPFAAAGVTATAFSPDGALSASVDGVAEMARLTLEDVGIYGVVLVSPEASVRGSVHSKT